MEIKADERLYFEDDLELGIKKSDYSKDVFDRHINRYRCAIEFAAFKGGVWLDCGSGSGYGTELIAKTAEKVIGVEMDKTTVEYAQKKHVSSNITYLHGNINEINSLLKGYEQKIDVITCIEVLEHLESAYELLQGVNNLLRRGGSLILTTPLSKLGGGPNPDNKFHVNEFTFEQLFEFIVTVFKHDNIIFKAENIFATTNKTMLFVYAKCVKS